MYNNSCIHLFIQQQIIIIVSHLKIEKEKTNIATEQETEANENKMKIFILLFFLKSFDTM